MKSTAFKLVATSLLLTLGLSQTLWAQRAFDEKVTTEGNIRMTVNNLGLIGNAFRGSYNSQGFPSCRFPATSTVEHLFQGGLWVGGIRTSSGSIATTTGAMDASQGYVTGAPNFEFTTNPGSRIVERSSLKSKGTLYKPNAISHQDYLCQFVDTHRIVPGTQITVSGHTPMGLSVRMETYNWNFSFSNFFVVLNFWIKNVDRVETYDSVYVGYWADPVVRAVNITPPGGTPFFAAGLTGYIDSLKLAYESDANGDTLFTRSYFALKYLGGTDKSGFRYDASQSPLAINRNFRINFNSWSFNSSSPLFFTPGTDQLRYLKLREGFQSLPDWPNIQEQLRAPGNRSLLISAGPYASLAPGDSINVTFAVVCARRNEDGTPVTRDSPLAKLNLINNARWAQTAYLGNDKNYDGQADEGGNAPVRRFVLPSPPDIPGTRVVVRNNAVDVFWSDNAEKSIDPISNTADFQGYRLFRTRLGFDTETIVNLDSSFQLVKNFFLKNGRIVYYEGNGEVELARRDTTFEGDTTVYKYKYTLSDLQNGWQHVVGLTAYDGGDRVNNLGPLESNINSNSFRVFPGTTPGKDKEPFVYPNPYYADAAWEGRSSTRPENKRLMFANLPARCVIRVFSSAGDLIDEFEHNQQNPIGDNRWFTTFSDPQRVQMSGGEHAWDLLSKNTQIISRGLYLFSVEDLETKDIQRGQFVIIR